MITFKVEGKCQPKQRPRVTKSGHAFTPKRTKDYEHSVQIAFKSEYSGSVPLYPEGIPVVAFITVHQQIPKNWSKKKTQMALDEDITPVNHCGDLDNFAKSILDSLNGLAFADDCQVVRMIVRKVYALEPYAEVTLMCMDEYSVIREYEVKLP